jgi:hypothetical protein
MPAVLLIGGLGLGRRSDVVLSRHREVGDWVIGYYGSASQVAGPPLNVANSRKTTVIRSVGRP